MKAFDFYCLNCFWSHTTDHERCVNCGKLAVVPRQKREDFGPQYEIIPVGEIATLAATSISIMAHNGPQYQNVAFALGLPGENGRYSEVWGCFSAAPQPYMPLMRLAPWPTMGLDLLGTYEDQQD